ncbi:hypothetical protein [Paraburkholderia youngii]|uniref:hypothetical protein n=1 Tax=Paraburkholderia youngii TaxID=2782701 RepID=UPI003D223529
MHDFESVDLRLHADVREKVRRANWAVLEAIYSFKGHVSAESHTLLGMSEVAFQHVLGLPVGERQRIGNVGIPIWKACVDVSCDRATPNELRVSLEGSDVLERLASAVTSISLTEIRKANRAILEAILSFRDRIDPAATFLLGLTAKRLDSLNLLKARDVQQISLANVPIWRARFEIAPQGDGKGGSEMVLGRDHMMRTLMKELAAG